MIRNHHLHSKFIFFILIFSLLTGILSQTCIISVLANYELKVSKCYKLVYEINLVDNSTMEIVFGSNWNNIYDDRYEMGAKEKVLISEIVESYNQWTIYADQWNWTKFTFSSDPDYQDSIYESVKKDPKLAENPPKICPTPISSYLTALNLTSYNFSTSTTNLTLYLKSSQGVNYSKVYLYNITNGFLDKYQFRNESDYIFYEYELISAEIDSECPYRETYGESPSSFSLFFLLPGLIIIGILISFTLLYARSLRRNYYKPLTNFKKKPALYKHISKNRYPIEIVKSSKEMLFQAKDKKIQPDIIENETFREKCPLSLISEDFFKKVDQFQWEDEDQKVEFLDEMLALTPEEREEVFEYMFKKAKNKELKL